MSTWDIRRRVIDPHTGHPVSTLVCSGVGLEYHGEWMDDEYVMLTVKSSVAIDFRLDDYVEYRGEFYYLCYDPNVVKSSRRGSFKDGFTYSNVKFYAISHKLKSIDFKDIVLFDNNIAYTSLSAFSFFCR